MLTKLLDKLLRIANQISWLGPLLVRIVVGVTFMGTGWGKLHGLDKITDYFTELHIPMPHFNAVLVANTEFFGGLFILIGLATRLVALPMAFTMVIAIITAKLPDAKGAMDVLGFEEMSYLVMFLWLALAGPGKASADHFVWRAMHKERA
jgi:putative oxidoreductase